MANQRRHPSIAIHSSVEAILSGSDFQIRPISLVHLYTTEVAFSPLSPLYFLY